MQYWAVFVHLHFNFLGGSGPVIYAAFSFYFPFFLACCLHFFSCIKSRVSWCVTLWFAFSCFALPAARHRTGQMGENRSIEDVHGGIKTYTGLS